VSKPTGYIVRSGDMLALLGALGIRGDQGAVYDAARTLVGWAEPMQTQQTQLPPVSVASLALPPEADALDRIADAYLADQSVSEALAEIADILSETGRL